MIVSTQGANASIRGKVPEFNRQVGTTGCQVRPRGCEIKRINGIGMPLERPYVITTFVIPNLVHVQYTKSESVNDGM